MSRSLEYTLSFQTTSDAPSRLHSSLSSDVFEVLELGIDKMLLNGIRFLVDELILLDVTVLGAQAIPHVIL